MAVARSDSGTIFKDFSAVTTADVTTLTLTGTPTCLIAILQFDGTVTNLGSQVFWDPAGTNQQMTQAGVVAGSGQSYIFYLYNPTAGNKTLRSTWTTSRHPRIGAIGLSGSQTSGVITAVTKTGNDTTANVTLTGTTTGITIGAYTCANAYFSADSPTELWGGAVGWIGYNANYVLATVSPTHTATVASNPWGAIGIVVPAPASADTQEWIGSNTYQRGPRTILVGY